MTRKKKDIEKITKKVALCPLCQYWTDKCEFKANRIIVINRRVEKVKYAVTTPIFECEYFKRNV